MKDKSEPVYYGKTVTKPIFPKPGQQAAFFYSMCAAAKKANKKGEP